VEQYFLFRTYINLGHKNILKYRSKFKTVEEHDETIIENWNKVVTKKRHIVWVLGDFFIKNNKYDFNGILKRLNGTIRIIPGNHCYMPYYPKEMIWNGIYKKYGYWLSHAPVHPDELRGHRNLHGHVHNKTIPDDRYINVCVENINYTPISLDAIREQSGGFWC